MKEGLRLLSGNSYLKFRADSGGNFREKIKRWVPCARFEAGDRRLRGPNSARKFRLCYAAPQASVENCADNVVLRLKCGICFLKSGVAHRLTSPIVERNILDSGLRFLVFHSYHHSIYAMLRAIGFEASACSGDFFRAQSRALLLKRKNKHDISAAKAVQDADLGTSRPSEFP